MLTYLYILLMFVLLPVRMIFSFISQVFWFPNFKLNKSLDSFEMSDQDYKDIINKSRTYLDSVGDGGDGAKFLSMYHFASRIDPNNVPETDHIYRYYHEDKTFMRKFKLEDNIGYTNFSGDMMSGIIFARAADICYNVQTRAADYISIIKNIIFNKIPFMVPHPHGEYHGRGFMWPVWGDGADVLKCVAMIDTAIEVGKQIGKPQYQLMFIKYLILTTNLPLYMWSYDSAFFVGNAYLTKWFGPHSRFLCMYSGYTLTGAWYYRLAMKRLFIKYGDIVPDIAYLYKYAFPKENVDVKRANFLVDSYTKHGKGTEVYNGPKVMCTHVENLLLYPFKKDPYKVERSAMVLEPRYRYESNIWEREPFKFKTGDQTNSKANCLDLVLSASLSRKI